MRAAIAIAVVLSSCSTTPDEPPRPEPLGALPGPGAADTDRFRDSQACAQCHDVDDDTPVLHDATGANVSPVRLWRGSLMANAARDPFFLAVFEEEIEHQPERKVEIEKLCTRCHAPAGHEELARSGGHLSFDDLVMGSSPAANLGREGVTCTLCHQIAASGLGDDTTFTGKFSVGSQRQIFGLYSDPRTSPMQLIVDFTPTYGAHVGNSALCATCHTVIVPTPSGEVVEQATYLEWRASEFSPNRSCQSCHIPPVDSTDQPISTVIASFPEDLTARMPVGRHDLAGGSSYILQLLADAVEWSGAGIPASELLASAARSDALMATAGRITIRDAHREGSDLVITVRVENGSGHKLPTGYPSRRVWIHLRVSAGGSTVFESGAPGTLPAEQPHYDQISSPSEVQIYEANLVDLYGEPTHRALDARRYSKDNRLLPRGFAPTGLDRTRTEPLGASGDTDFVAGSDDVTYRVPAPANAMVDVELLYTSLRPETVEAVEAGRTRAGSRFVDLVRARPITSVLISRTSQNVP